MRTSRHCAQYAPRPTPSAEPPSRSSVDATVNGTAMPACAESLSDVGDPAVMVRRGMTAAARNRVTLDAELASIELRRAPEAERRIGESRRGRAVGEPGEPRSELSADLAAAAASGVTVDRERHACHPRRIARIDEADGVVGPCAGQHTRAVAMGCRAALVDDVEGAEAVTHAAPRGEAPERRPVLIEHRQPR